VATVADFSERWKAEVLSHLKPSTRMAAEGHLSKHIIPSLGSLRLDELTAEQQQQLITRLSATVSRKTSLNILTTLSSMLGKAEAWGYVTATVNRKQLTLPRSERIRRRFFSAEEIRRIVARAPEPLATICFLAARTGLREGEIFSLKVSGMDFERRTLTVSRSAWRGKLQSPKRESSMRVLHMPDALAKRLKAYLSTWRSNSLDLLFASRRGTPINPNHLVARKLHPLLDKLKIERAGFRAFRHSDSSLLIGLGAGSHPFRPNSATAPRSQCPTFTVTRFLSRSAKRLNVWPGFWTVLDGKQKLTC
jgi:integrase